LVLVSDGKGRSDGVGPALVFMSSWWCSLCRDLGDGGAC